MAQNVHITHIYDTQANLLAGLDLAQLGIKTAATAQLPYEEILYTNDDKSYIYAVQPSQRYDVSGGTWAYLDAAFDKIECNDNTDGILTARWLRHLGDTDTHIDFEDDKLTIAVGGVDMVTITEDGTQDKVEINAGTVDIDTAIHANSISNALFVEGSSGTVYVRNGGSGGVTVDADGDQFVVEAGTGGVAGMSILASSSTPSFFLMGSNSDEDFFTVEAYATGFSGADYVTQTMYDIAMVKYSGSSGATAIKETHNSGNADIDFVINTDTLSNTFLVDGGTNRVAIGHATPDVLFHVEQDTSTTNAVQYLLRLTETCSGTVADGFGVGIQFELENSTQATPYVAGAIETLWEDDSDVDSDMVFRVMDAGSLVEGMRLTSAKNLAVGGTVTAPLFQSYTFTKSCGAGATVDILSVGSYGSTMNGMLAVYASSSGVVTNKTYAVSMMGGGWPNGFALLSSQDYSGGASAFTLSESSSSGTNKLSLTNNSAVTCTFAITLTVMRGQVTLL